MNDELMILRNRLRDLVRSWICLAGADSLETLARLYLADLDRAFEPSAQDRLVIRSHKEALRTELAELSKKTELAQFWRDIVRELIADEVQQLDAPIPKTTSLPAVSSTGHRSRTRSSRRTITRLQAFFGMLFVLASVAIFTWFLVRRGWYIAPEADVEIHYNYTVDVGAMIGWTLAGIGIASAGVAYAIKLTSEMKQAKKETED